MGLRRKRAALQQAKGLDFFGRRFRNNPNEQMAEYGPFAGNAGEWVKRSGYATLVTSLLGGGLHAPVIDLDLPCAWVPSTAPGHGHLYINKAMPWSDVVKLLDVMVEVGLVEPGFRDASVKRGWASVRTPWTRKPGANRVQL